jgi:hypothetical protein
LRNILNPRFARAGIGHHRNDQTAALIMPARLRQLTLGSIDDAVNLAGDDADGRFHPRRR